MSTKSILRIIVPIFIIIILGIGIKIGIANAQVHPSADLHGGARSHQSALEYHNQQAVPFEVQHPM
jgi:hypothetical protein